jgi:hypothetical protein
MRPQRRLPGRAPALLPSRGSAAALALWAALALLLPGCATRSVKKVVYENPDLEVSLRRDVKLFRTVKKRYDHPIEIAPSRVTYILAAIDVETHEGKAVTVREAAFPTEILYDVGEAVSKAFTEAGPDQQLVVKAMRKERRLGLFHRKYLTSFTTYVKDDLLYVHLGRVNWKVPKRDEGQGKIPDPSPGRREMDFRVRQARGMRVVGPQDVAVEWRDPVFASSKILESRGAGAPKRRTVLMEEVVPEGEAPVAGSDDVEDLSPEVLRALAELEEQRRSGAITEIEYQSRRYDILRKGTSSQPQPDSQPDSQPTP